MGAMTCVRMGGASACVFVCARGCSDVPPGMISVLARFVTQNQLARTRPVPEWRPGRSSETEGEIEARFAQRQQKLPTCAAKHETSASKSLQKSNSAPT